MEIKDRMETLEQNQSRDSKSKTLEVINSRLDQIEVELHKGKEELTNNVKYEVNKAVAWEMEKVRREIRSSLEDGLHKMVQSLEDRDTTKNGDSPRRDQTSPSSTNTNNYKSNSFEGEIPRKDTDHKHSSDLNQPTSNQCNQWMDIK